MDRCHTKPDKIAQAIEKGDWASLTDAKDELALRRIVGQIRDHLGTNALEGWEREMLRHSVANRFVATKVGAREATRLAKIAVPEPTKGERGEEQPKGVTYDVRDNHLFVIRHSKFGDVPQQLCNLVPSMREEIRTSDGTTDEPSIEYVMGGISSSGKELPEIRVPASQFDLMKWIRRWGPEHILEAGIGITDHVRVAIQKMNSEKIPRRVVYSHTGWAQIDGGWQYLTTNGAVGSSEAVEVNLDRELRAYDLPRNPENIQEAMRASLRLWDLAPHRITVPLWAGVFRAPLASTLAANLTIWLEGGTGAYKSSLAGLFLCHWGKFDYATLPSNWSSTANYLEHQAFVLKDAMLVIDEYMPPVLERKRWEATAARLIRAQGNLSGRGRMNRELRTRSPEQPRGLILSTGEERPAGQSILARMFVMHVKKQEVRFDPHLLAADRYDAPRLPHAMAGYVSWLAPQLEDLRRTLPQTLRDRTQEASENATHMRIPATVAHLWIGLDRGLAFAEEIGACSSAEAENLRAKGWVALIETADRQARLVGAEKATAEFLESLATCILQKRAKLLISTQMDPRDAEPEPAVVGWEDGEGKFYLLIPDAAFKVAFARYAPEEIKAKKRRIIRDLTDEDLTVKDEDRFTTTRKVGGKKRRVILLHRSALDEYLCGRDE